MKLSSLRYLTKEGFKNTWANRLMSVASIGVLVACMVAIGLAILISENAKLALGNLEKQNVVMAYMKDYTWAFYSDKEDNEQAGNAENAEQTETGDDAEQPDENGIKSSDYVIHNEEEAKALCDKIAKLDNVESVEYISGEEGLEDIKKDFLKGQEEYFTFLDEKYGNPLSGAAKVTMKDMSLFSATIEKIEKIDGVDKIQSYGDLAEKISALKKGLGIAGFWIIAILMIISLVIVSNTIRITMYSRKLEISIMKAVGATDSFVRIPFIVEGILIGLISAIFSEGLLYFCYRVATETICATLGTNDIIKYSDLALNLFGLFVIIGVVAGVIGSITMIGKYLHKEGSEFAAI
ncbi:MAG: ABC transporter permease [Clostridia bacterium]|nr:ABC transporter permease [Clostridia bacterium]